MIKKGNLRCDRHNMPITETYSCMDYVPAPELAEARRIWKLA